MLWYHIVTPCSFHVFVGYHLASIHTFYGVVFCSFPGFCFRVLSSLIPFRYWCSEQLDTFLFLLFQALQHLGSGLLQAQGLTHWCVGVILKFNTVSERQRRANSRGCLCSYSIVLNNNLCIGVLEVGYFNAVSSSTLSSLALLHLSVKIMGMFPKSQGCKLGFKFLYPLPHCQLGIIFASDLCAGGNVFSI